MMILFDSTLHRDSSRLSALRMTYLCVIQFRLTGSEQWRLRVLSALYTGKSSFDKLRMTLLCVKQKTLLAHLREAEWNALNE